GFEFFFFQAEDGIRDGHVTGVQTCALPISAVAHGTDCWRAGENDHPTGPAAAPWWFSPHHSGNHWTHFRCDGCPGSAAENAQPRSEERRVGKECRCRSGRYEKRKEE